MERVVLSVLAKKVIAARLPSNCAGGDHFAIDPSSPRRVCDQTGIFREADPNSIRRAKYFFGFNGCFAIGASWPAVITRDGCATQNHLRARETQQLSPSAIVERLCQMPASAIATAPAGDEGLAEALVGE